MYHAFPLGSFEFTSDTSELTWIKCTVSASIIENLRLSKWSPIQPYTVLLALCYDLWSFITHSESRVKEYTSVQLHNGYHFHIHLDTHYMYSTSYAQTELQQYLLFNATGPQLNNNEVLDMTWEHTLSDMIKILDNSWS